MSKREIARLLRLLMEGYRGRFHECAPMRRAPVPVLAQKRLDVVAVNGGRALHFFFWDSGRAADTPVDGGRLVTRLHDVTLWPPDVGEQKRLGREDPQGQRELVRRVAMIDGQVYVHFVLYPQDGDLGVAIGAVGRRLAEREVARHEGEALEAEVPEQSVVTGTGAKVRGDPTLDPAP